MYIKLQSTYCVLAFAAALTSASVVKNAPADSSTNPADAINKSIASAVVETPLAPETNASPVVASVIPPKFYDDRDHRISLNVGAACGRPGTIADCGHGLVCVINPDAPPQVPGVCVPKGIQFTGRGSQCHEWAPVTTRCLPGLECKPFEPARGDGPGICEPV
ncbi:hypothetical protein BDF19DRAFT_423482 [Syncephalis fuscata]|nr:hypothetical protein BDF19DRAFT_423482 [Syncephalis fuscata]